MYRHAYARVLVYVAHGRDTIKLNRLGKSLQKTTQEWAPALDLVLWCLQGTAARRPQSMAQVLAHRFFDASGSLHLLDSAEETWEAFMQRQAEDLHAALDSKDHTKAKELFDCGGVHLNMPIERTSTVRPLHRTTFSGDIPAVQVILDQIPDEWPLDVKQEYLDVRTDGYTAYMIACECGFVELANMLVKKGCSTELTNDFGQTGKKLADAFVYEQDWSTVRPWDRGDQLHLTVKDLESHLDMQQRAHDNADVRAGIRIWNSKLAAYHLSKEQMRALEVSIASLLPKNFSVAVRFVFVRVA